MLATYTVSFFGADRMLVQVCGVLLEDGTNVFSAHESDRVGVRRIWHGEWNDLPVWVRPRGWAYRPTTCWEADLDALKRAADAAWSGVLAEAMSM